MLNDLGVLPDSARYYHEADEFTTSALFYVPRAGIYHCGREYQFSREGSDMRDCQIMMIDKGSLGMEYGAHGELNTQINAGSLGIIHLGTKHRYFSMDRELRMYWMQLAGRGIYAYFERIRDVNGYVMELGDFEGVRAEMDRLFGLLAGSYGDPQEISICVHGILRLLTMPSSGEGAKREDPVMEEAAAYMEANYADRDLSVERLAANAALNESYFVRRFKLYHGKTPHQYLLHQRVLSAKTMLDTGSMSVEEIAWACGFGSPSHFVMTFRKATGMTPMQFRNMWR